MASKTRFVHFSSFAFLGLLVFFSIHQVSVSYLEHRTLPSTQKPTPDYGNIVSHGDFDPGHVLHDLSKRAPPETAAEALNKAEGYWCLLTNLDTNEGSNLYSKYADPKDLDKYWLSKSWPSKDGLTDTGATIPDALAAIGLPGKQGDQGLQAYYYEQDQEFNVDGVLEEVSTHNCLTQGGFSGSQVLDCMKCTHPLTFLLPFRLLGDITAPQFPPQQGIYQRKTIIARTRLVEVDLEISSPSQTPFPTCTFSCGKPRRRSKGRKSPISNTSFAFTLSILIPRRLLWRSLVTIFHFGQVFPTQ